MTDNRIDIYLQRGSHLATIAAVAVGLLVFFYTVRPIYERDRLTEEVAQKTIELKKLGESVSSERDAAAKAIADQAIAKAKLVDLLSELDAKKDQMQGLQATLDALRVNISTLESEKLRAASNVGAALFVMYLDQVIWCAVVNGLRSNDDRLFDLLENEPQKVAEISFPSPYAILTAAVQKADLAWLENNVGKGIITQGDVDAFSGRVKEAAAAAKNELSRGRFDVRKIVQKYLLDRVEEDKQKAVAKAGGQGLDPYYRDHVATSKYADLITAGKIKNQTVALAGC
jgi:hypothetical protein